MTGPALALIALVPLMLGSPPQQAGDAAITVTLCNGGLIQLDLGGSEREPERPRDCHQQGCHAGPCREKARPRGPR